MSGAHEQDYVSPREAGELKASMDGLRQSVDLLREDLSSNYVRNDVHERDLELIRQEVAAVKDDVASHSTWMTWGTRIVLTFFLMAALYAAAGTPHLPT